MTYRKLIDSLTKIPDERLDDDVLFSYDTGWGNGEILDVKRLLVADSGEPQSIEDGHFYLSDI